MYHFDPTTNFAVECSVTPCEFNSHFDTALAAEFHHFVLEDKPSRDDDVLLKDFAEFLTEVQPSYFVDERDGGEV